VFAVEDFLAKVGEGSGGGAGGSGEKRGFGLQDGEERGSKRARIDEDSD
jgi:hypothetical protein